VAKRRARGEGSIFKEGTTGYWCAEISLPNGKRKKKRSKSQTVVMDWLLDQRKLLKTNLLLPDDKILYRDFLDRFLKEVAEPTLKPKTVYSYEWLIRLHIKPNLGHLPITKIRPDHLQTLYAEKLSDGLSKRSVQHMHAVIRRSLNQALRWGLIYQNPTSRVTAPTPDKRPHATLTADQAKHLLESSKSYRLYPVYVLAITTGMRMGEILGLRWEDVRFEAGSLSVNQTIQLYKGKPLLGEPKTAASRRTISLTKLALEALNDIERSEGLVFRTKNGTPYNPRNVGRDFEKALARAGLARIRFHDLRHTAATLLLKENVHPKIVQEMLGHSSISLTLDTYSHILPDIQKEATEKMDKLFEV